MSGGHQNRIRAKCKAISFVHAESDLTIMTTTRDLSLNGLFLETHQELPVGSKCSIELITEGNRKLAVQAEVVRVDMDGVGVKFLDMSHETFFELKLMVRDYVSDIESFDKQCSERCGFK